MTNLPLKIIMLLFIVLVFACTKPDEEKNISPENEVICIDSEFSIIVNHNIIPACIFEDSKSNILILGEEENKITVIKMDPYGTTLWVTYFDNMYGKPMTIIGVSDGGYILTSGRMHFESAFGNPINSCSVQEGFELDSTNNYQSYFVTKNNYTPEYQISLDNFIYVSKIDEDGNILNQVSEGGNYTPGQIIQKLESGDFELLMTAFRYTGDGVHQIYPWDPFELLKNKNGIYFYKIDGDGNIGFSNSIQEVLIMENMEEITDSKIEFCLSVHGDQYVVNLPNETYLTDHYGFEQKKYQPHFNFTGNHTFSMAYADSVSNYFIGRADFFIGDIKYYLLKAELDGSIIWYNDFDEIDEAKLRSTGDGFLAMISENDVHKLLAYNSDGSLKWQQIHDEKPDFFIPSCSGGVILVNYNETYNLLSVSKSKQ